VRGLRRDGGVHHGQENHEGRPLARSRIHPDLAPVTLHDPSNGGESQAPAVTLRREEGIEDLGERGFVHALAVVMHLEHDAQFAIAISVGARDRKRAQDDFAGALLDRVHGIHDQVQDDLAQARRIGIDERKPTVELQAHVDASLRGGAQEVADLGDESIEVEMFRPK